MHILLSNDDGLHAEGLQLLRSTLREACPGARITTVAPDREQSATSHALTLSDPLRVEPFGDDQYAVSGTPTDCILLALNGILREDPPDVVVSGINHGPNMGEDVHYSGTVAAAFEGMVLGLPAVALSLASKQRPRDFRAARHFVAEVLPGWLEGFLRRPHLLNINIPARDARDIEGLRVCRLGSRQYTDDIVCKEDPRGREYYWIGGDSVTYAAEEDTDFVLCAKGFITVTPLKADLTDHHAMAELERQEGDWSP